jgi:hypothetical protein
MLLTTTILPLLKTKNALFCIWPPALQIAIFICHWKKATPNKKKIIIIA